MNRRQQYTWTEDDRRHTALLERREGIRTSDENNTLQMLYLQRWLAAKFPSHDVLVWQYSRQGYCGVLWRGPDVESAMAWIKQQKRRRLFIERFGKRAHRVGSGHSAPRWRMNRHGVEQPRGGLLKAG